eukprot:scaffold587_cov339-Pavlova_lutheri.AAC.33
MDKRVDRGSVDPSLSLLPRSSEGGDRASRSTSVTGWADVARDGVHRAGVPQIIRSRRSATDRPRARPSKPLLPGRMDRIQRLFSNVGAGGLGGPPSDAPMVDTAEQVYISSLALLKMLKHGA